MTKDEAGYQLAQGPEQCANCVMFRSGSCTLVAGLIEPYATCMYWEMNPGDVTPVAERLMERGSGAVPTGL